MAARYFNWKLATVLVAAITVFSVAAYALHQWQKTARAVQSLPLGDAAYAQQDYDEAASQYGRYVAVNGDDVEILLKYAEAQLKRRPTSRGNAAEAFKAYRSVLRLDSHNLKAVRGLMELYLLSRDSVGEAELVAQHFLENNDDVGIRRMHAEALRLLHKPKEAAAELKENLEKHPDDVQSYEMMGWLANELKENLEKHPNDVQSYEVMGWLAKVYPDIGSKQAVLWFDDAIAKNPRSALAYIARAGFHLWQKDRDKALADLEQAQKCDLPDTETRGRLVGGLIGAKLLDQAREQLKAWQAKDPTDLLLWQYWAELARQASGLALRANDPALQASTIEEMHTVAEAGLKALAAQPWDFMRMATELLVLSGHIEEAKDCIAQMRQKGVEPVTTPYLEGLVADREGRSRDAILDWRKAIALGYGDPTVRRLLASARRLLASALAGLGDTQSAIGELRILLTDDTGNLDGHVALAQLLVQTSEWKEAQDQALEAQRLSPDPNYAEAILPELQARTYLLEADTRPAAEREQAWQVVETRLAQLDKTPGKTEEVALSAKLLQARVAMIRNKLPEATSMLTDLESKYPSEVRVAMLQAQLCLAQGKKEEAKARFQEAVAKFPQASEAARALALFFNQQNQHEECESVIKEGLARMQEPRSRRNLGLMLTELYQQWGQEDKLTPWLSDLATQFPSDIQLRCQLLTRPEIVKDPAKAQSLVDEIKSLEGDGGWQWRFEQARLWSGSGGEEFKTRYPEIVKLLQENLLTNPKDHASRLLLAQTYERASEWSLAATTYQELQRALPDNVPILVRTIATLYQAKDYDAARRLLDQADRRNLHDPGLDKLRLWDDAQQGKLTEVEIALEKMVSRDPNDTASGLRLAAIYTQQKKYGEAQKILDHLRTKMPDSMPVATVQINLYIQQGKAEEAIRLCSQIVDKLPNAPAYMLRARVYTALKQYEKPSEDFYAKALEDFGRIIALDPKNAESRASRADFYRVIRRARDGVPDIRKALELAPDNRTLQRLAVMLFVDSRDPSLLGEAETLLDKALAPLEKAPPTSAQGPELAEYAQLLMLKAQILVTKGSGPGIDEACRILRDVTARQPALPEAWRLLGQIELDQEEPDKALDVAVQGLVHNKGSGPLLLLKARAEKARSPAMAALTLKELLDQEPNNVQVLIDLADAYARSGHAKQAVDLLGQKLKLPEFKDYARRLCEIAYAEAQYANGQRDEALALFDKLTQADPNDATPTMSLAQQLRRERLWTEMNQLVRRWLATHPNDADVATRIAGVLRAAGDKQALLIGEDILRMTLDRNPRSLGALSLLAMMMQDEGRNEDSAERYRKVLEIDPKNVIAMNNLAWILCDRENRPQKEYKEALELAQKGLQIVSDNVDLLDTRGYAYYHLGEFDKAMADFDKCIKLYPANSPLVATPRFHMALVYAAMKRNAEAVGHLRTAQDTNRSNLRAAGEQAQAGRVTYAIKVLRDALQLQEQMEPLRVALGLSETSGLSAQEVAKAKTLLERLQKGI
ncbi:MAG: tetratricopeptide repeat protein [Phycisphaerae bacterium]|nr:tetratricopeptide repeat protein [Phycisphaerae bacterium]